MLHSNKCYKTFMHSSLLILCNSDMQLQEKISESCVDMVYHCMFGVYISLFQGREGRERERERDTHTHTDRDDAHGGMGSFNL